MADPPPTDLAARRAERARRNGARSRGPVSERGKARSSRNALRHGLTAKVHLVLDRDDEVGFMALAAGLDADLAPRGTLEGFLVARLTAAMWHTGRAERMEARAFAAAIDPDPDRLRLAMRYRGSVQRELFRCLRALQELRRRPLASVEGDAGGTPEPERPERQADQVPPIAVEPADPARVALAAWGGERAGQVPPGFLELRPVPRVWPIAWRFVQDRAFPGDVPLLVYADGTVRSPEGHLLEDVWSPEPLPSQMAEPAASSPPHASPPAGVSTAPEPAIAARSALDWLDDDRGEDDDFGDLLPTPRRRNEPTQPLGNARFPEAATLHDGEAVAPRIGLGRMPPELVPALEASGERMALQPLPELTRDQPPSHDVRDPDPPRSPPREADHSARRRAWERMWGISPSEVEPIAVANDTFEPDVAGMHEQNCTSELLPCTSEPDAADARGRNCTSEFDSCTSEPENGVEAAALSSEAPVSSNLHEPTQSSSRPDGRPARIRRRNPTWSRRRSAASPEAGE